MTCITYHQECNYTHSTPVDVGLAQARPMMCPLEMASLPRVRISRLVGTGMRSRAVLRRLAPVSRWRCLAAASSSSWSGVQNATSDLQFYQRQQLLQRRGYASDLSFSLIELRERVIDVFKLFDKVKADEASGKGWGRNSFIHSPHFEGLVLE